MKLSKLLKLQVLYIALAVGYNIVSLIAYKNTGRPLTASVPTISMIASLLIAGALCFTALFKTKIIYRVLMGLIGLRLIYSGIVPHIVTDVDAYYNFIAWLSAIAINVYGTTLFIIAALGKFKD